MFYSAVSTLVYIILILLIGEGEALRCWQCSSETDRFCGDPLTIVNGSGSGSGVATATVCDEQWGRAHRLHSHAVCKKVTHRVSNKLVTVRSCGWDSSGTYGWGPCSTNALSQYPAFEYCGICQRDACNRAAAAGHQLTILPHTTQVVIYVSIVIYGLRLQTLLHL